jgi:ribose transport system substrate-binding protein
MHKKILLVGFLKYFILIGLVLSSTIYAHPASHNNKLYYLVSDINIPFWDIMTKGASFKAKELGYELIILSANNLAKKELQNTVKAIKDKALGIILSPTNSSAAVTILKLANKENIPVVVSDIGADKGEFVSFISSNNEDGAYKLGKILTKELHKRGWQNGTVGIIAIPQKRANGKARTRGFMKALLEADIKGSNIYQQVDFSYKETYDFSKKLIDEDKKLRAIWLQGSDRYKGALDAIEKSGKKDKILLICFDAEPIFLDLIPKGTLVGAGMQQPYLMGEKAVVSLDGYLNGLHVEHEQQLPILAISKQNIAQKLPLIKRNVLGLNSKGVK